MRRPMRFRLSKQLTMREVAQLLGDEWCSGPEGKPTGEDMRRLRRRLRRLEAETGHRLLFGGGVKGRRGGGRCWTTFAALRRADLVDDIDALASVVADRFEELRDAITMSEETTKALARAHARLAGEVAALQRKVARQPTA